MGLTARLFLLTLVALLPAIAVQVYNEFALRSDREREVHLQSLENAQLAASELDRIFVGIENLLIAVAKEPSVQALDTARCVPYLASLQPDVPHLSSISVIDGTGLARCRAQTPAPDLTFADRVYFQQAMRGEPFVVGSYTLDRVSGAPVLPLAVPLRDSSGRVIGAVAAALDLRWLGRHFAERGVQPGGAVTIADRRGTILIREPSPERFVGTVIPSHFQPLLTAASPGSTEVTSQDGTRRILGYVPVASPPRGVYVSSGISSEVAFSAVNHAARRGALLIALGLLLALLVAWRAGRFFITRPVNRLLQAAEAWGRGDLGARSGLRGGGEFNRIGEVFDRVAGEVQRRAEALGESEARLRSLADNLPNGMVYQIGVEPDGSRRFLYISEGVERLIGAKVADVLSDPAVLYGAIVEEDRPALAAAETEALRTSALFNVEARMRRTDGTVRWFQLASAPRGMQGGVAVWDGVALDITQRKQAEQELRGVNDTLEHRVAERTGELAAANRELLAQIEERQRVEKTLAQMQRLEAVGQLTSGVAHDFNNLLTVILGNLEFLSRSGLDAKAKRRLDMMRAAAERGAKLTDQLLAFSRRQRLEPRQLDLNETVSSMTELLQSTMGGSVMLEVSLGAGLWPALVDPTQIELVILNLAINARDAMQVGGTLTVATENVRLDEEPLRPEEPAPGEYVVISVTDTGSGMSEEVRAKAFEPFFTTKEVGKGSGLGLAQVYGFAKQSGGGVRIRTALGQGTTVQVFLPRATGSAATGPEQSVKGTETGSSGRNRVILLVDDDDAVREVSASLLTELGYRVIEAGSGGAALDILSQRPDVDLLLVDFAMPGMNGAAVAHEARSKRPDLPVLFVTGYADFSQLEAVAEDMVILKPFRGEELAEKVQAALDDAAPDVHREPNRLRR
jgi:PAS domain S-box-containing protein